MRNDDETIDKILQRVLSFQPYDADVSVCLASVPNLGKPVYQRLSITDDLTDEFRGIASLTIAELQKQTAKGNLVIHPYEDGCKLDSHELENLDLSKFDVVASQIAPLANPIDLDIFDNSEEFRTNLRFFAIVFQPTDSPASPIHCFRFYNKGIEITRNRKSKIFGALLNKDHYDTVTEPLFLFDRQIDCIAADSQMLILNKSNFQRIFSFFEIVQAKGKETIDLIKAQIPMFNPEEFEESCTGNLPMLLKLNNIASKNYFNQITSKDIENVLKAFPELGVELTEGPNPTIIFDPKRKWNLLRLLDDGFLSSVMTLNQYEVSSKRLYRKSS